MMTPRLMDVDSVTAILERVQGLLILAENQIDSMFDSNRVPLNSAIWCINEQVNAVVELLNAGVPEREEKPS